MVYLIIFILFLFSCGIKADTQVLLAPKIEVIRMGSNVYVIPLEGQIFVEHFQKKGSIFYKEEEKPFCFTVKRMEGKRIKHCVDEAIRQTPSISIAEYDDRVIIKALNFERFALYPYADGEINVLGRKLINREHEIKKEYKETCYALTGIVDSRETAPVIFCVNAKPKPHVEDVKDLEYRIVEDRLFIIWSYQGDYDSFVIYQDGKMLGETKGFLFEVKKPSHKTQFTVKVKTKEGFFSNGKSIIYSP